MSNHGSQKRKSTGGLSKAARDRLRELREAAGYDTQVKAERQMKLGQGQVSRWERGDQTPSLDSIDIIADTYHVDREMIRALIKDGATSDGSSAAVRSTPPQGQPALSEAQLAAMLTSARLMIREGMSEEADNIIARLISRLGIPHEDSEPPRANGSHTA